MSESPKFDAGKAPVHLVVPQFILGIAEILAFGAKKYSPWSWAAGKDWSRDYSAMQRHLLMFWAGQDLDSETGKSHLLHLACDTMFLFVSWLKGLGKDDRYVFPPDVLREMDAALRAAEVEAPRPSPARYLGPDQVNVKGGFTAFVRRWLEGGCAWCTLGDFRDGSSAHADGYMHDSCARASKEAHGFATGEIYGLIVAACRAAK